MDRPTNEAIDTLSQQVEQQTAQVVERSIQDSETVATAIRNQTVFVILAILLLTAGISWFTVRSVNVELQRAVEVASALSNASAGISSAAQELWRGTSEQAASVEETTASLEEMSASITQNAGNSSQSEQMAQKGAKDAQESQSVVRETVEAMRMIAEKIGIVE